MGRSQPARILDDHQYKCRSGSQISVASCVNFRAEEGSLNLKLEPHDLQEIISVVQDHGAIAFPKLMLDITLPEVGRPVLVDYEYLITSLELLCEAFEAVAGLEYIQIQATENQDVWFLDFKYLDRSIIALILSPLDWQTDRLPTIPSQPLEYLLRLHVARQILRLHGVGVEILDSITGQFGLRLRVPTAATESGVPLTQALA